MRSVRRPSPLLFLLATLLAVLLTAAACGSGSGSESEGDSGGDSVEAAEAEAQENAVDGPGPDERAADRSVADGEAFDDSLDATALRYGRPDTEDTARKIIAKGNVSLHSDDVAATALDVKEIADRYLGEVTEQESSTNKDGEVSDARLLLRIPVAKFDKAFADLEQVADLRSSDTGKEDVTTKVIDTQVRIRAQRRSLLRVEALFDRAQSISDIIRIESQVSRRQAELESLEQRLAYLTNQTSMSTVSVNISLPPKEKKEKKDEPEEAGFLVGLEDGWNALKSFGTDVATLSGRLLPWLPIILLVGVPLWILARRLWRHLGDAATGAAPAAAAPAKQ